MGRVLRGRKEYGPRVLTLDGLRRCVGLEAELDRADTELADMSANITVTKQAVATREQTLDSQRGALTSPEAIKSYNELVDEQSGANAQLAAQINAYNAKIDTSEQLVETYNRGCASRDYYEDDLKAVRAELAKPAP
jgi:chromosome segregation ATPase